MLPVCSKILTLIPLCLGFIITSHIHAIAYCHQQDLFLILCFVLAGVLEKLSCIIWNFIINIVNTFAKTHNCFSCKSEKRNLVVCGAMKKLSGSTKMICLSEQYHRCQTLGEAEKYSHKPHFIWKRRRHFSVKFRRSSRYSVFYQIKIINSLAFKYRAHL